ncbi:Na(+)-translocating NADH-quinone reductase subunit A [BD1-7 clade bacterium]|uniref:Na(+)-translocating NADH-quinone reductase subunit A n=1 Tax=BD1-7 clade bacterium TaxID=2029982 RepID=A0A5S9QVF3_9GAMM|nr:Na(+)-translocating NADH-quinone reductase subunit A [BD1-7 clade bacterium]CAA0122677.1 Na(+)-translocating NADH-quinone reductase subunit A [BD1-7 clade bacterium]
MIRIKRGLDLPIEGAPGTSIADAPAPRQVGIIGFDYVGMKPTMAVAVGDKVAKGQVLFEDKKTPGVVFTAPAAGTVSAINRGAKRVFQSLVIDVEGNDEVAFDTYDVGKLSSLERTQVVDNLVKSGLWTALRTRPFSRVPAIDSEPAALFINAMDTNPLAADPSAIINADADAFASGVNALSRLAGQVYLCHAPDTQMPQISASNVQAETFSGPHPAGLSGTHIHFLKAASETRTVWSINYQDVIAVGKLFTTGKLVQDRVISLAGPAVNNPTLVRTQVGANLGEMINGKLKAGENRVISGSVLGGRAAVAPADFLGRYDLQVTVLAEGYDRPFMGWLSPGADRFSVMGIYLSKLMPGKKFAFNTNTNGSPRAMVPVGNYEKIMPLDILPTQLLRSLIVGDMDTAIKLGALELDEEDLALCTYVCPGKYEYGPILRDNLTTIEKEG